MFLVFLFRIFVNFYYRLDVKTSKHGASKWGNSKGGKGKGKGKGKGRYDDDWVRFLVVKFQT